MVQYYDIIIEIKRRSNTVFANILQIVMKSFELFRMKSLAKKVSFTKDFLTLEKQSSLPFTFLYPGIVLVKALFYPGIWD